MEQAKRRGRPRRAEKKAAQITIYVDIDTLDEVDERARAAGISRSEWINQAIWDKLGREKSDE
ncbi:MAG: ribbon-helix-helix protein, CopG family [Clostridia bacterium]|nr:ribbon-helix-helix protein, CopG family [Clostridia bacterium]